MRLYTIPCAERRRLSSASRRRKKKRRKQGKATPVATLTVQAVQETKKEAPVVPMKSTYKTYTFFSYSGEPESVDGW
jgi:hypothetical protein